MRAVADGIDLSATDLSNFLACRHRTGLDRAVAEGKLKAPTWVDPIVEALRDRGAHHERTYVDLLKAKGLGRFADARGSDQRALTLVRQDAERRFIERRLREADLR